MKSETNTAISLENLAKSYGLVYFGTVTPSYEQDGERFTQWLSEGQHAGMQYLEQHPQIRTSPQAYFPEAQCVIVLGFYYGPIEKEDLSPQIARYARFKDYHKELKKRCEAFAKDLHGDRDFYRVAVDTAPILERALAAKTQEGFIGKNTLWIHPRFGSFFLLAEVFTSLAFKPDEKKPIDLAHKTKEGGCGPCRQCQVACPTGALDKAYNLDARKCLAYWTIENRGPIPLEFWPHLAKYYFGCDLCQTSCPYNIKPKDSLQHPSGWTQVNPPSLLEVATMSEKQYQQYFGGTALTRAKRAGLRRNALIALAVTQHPDLAKALESVGPNAEEPLPETVWQIRSGNY